MRLRAVLFLTVFGLTIISIPSSGLSGEAPKYRWSLGTDISLRYELSEIWAVEVEPELFSTTNMNNYGGFKRMGLGLSGIGTISRRKRFRLNGRAGMKWVRRWKRVHIGYYDQNFVNHYQTADIYLDAITAQLNLELEHRLPILRGISLSVDLIGITFSYREDESVNLLRPQGTYAEGYSLSRLIDRRYATSQFYERIAIRGRIYF